jgi:hypothetical protein
LTPLQEAAWQELTDITAPVAAASSGAAKKVMRCAIGLLYTWPFAARDDATIELRGLEPPLGP